MGKSVQKITEIVSLIASTDTWIEGLAIQQLIKASELAGMHRVAGMPDLHPGRGLGQSILVEHITTHNHDGLNTDDEDFLYDMTKHDEAVRWAELNRELIARRFLEAIRANGHAALDINHNLVSAKKIDDCDAWLHRKGATPGDQGYVVIPGSRGDYSYLVKPVSDNQANAFI